MGIKIITDSASDYEKQELSDKEVIRVPLTIHFQEDSYLDGTEISKEAFYKKLLKGDDFPKTAQPSPEAFLAHFKAAKENGDTVIAILLASGLSGTVQSATIAKSMADYDNIHIIDSCTAATGLRLLVDTAVKLRSKGLDAASIVNQIEDLKPRVKILAMVDTLEYLHRGGRLTKAQAKLGEMAKLKPIITVNQDGTISVVEKCLGKRRAYKKLSAMTESLDIDTDYPFYFVYSYNQDNCNKFVDILDETYDFINKKHMYDIGPTIGTHVGDGAFGLTCIIK